MNEKDKGMKKFPVPLEVSQWLEVPQGLSLGLRIATGLVLVDWSSRRACAGVAAAPGLPEAAAMAHKNVSYYLGQYKDRLLPLLRGGLGRPHCQRGSEEMCGRELQATEEDSTNSFICVLKKMKEMRLMEKVVEETEEAFEERMEAIAEQWRDLHARRAQLKAHVVTSGTTVKENERLRTQALNKAKEEKEENTKKESELLRARNELEALRKQHQKLSKKLLKYSPFKRYLENVVENSQVSLDVAQGEPYLALNQRDPVLQFRDIEDIISYYKALVRTRKDLLQSQWWHRQLMEQSKVLQQQIKAEKEAEMLQCKKDLVQLKESFDQAQSDICQWVRSCEVGGGALQGLPESGVAAGSSCSQGLMAGPSSRVCAGMRCLIPSLQEQGGRAHVWSRFVMRKSWKQQQVWEVTVAVLLHGICPCCGEGTVLAGKTCQGEHCRSCRLPGLAPGSAPTTLGCSFAGTCLVSPQEDRWAEVQDSAARKGTELKSLNMAIQNLFQAASTRLQPKDKVAAADSHRQLDMVQPGQSLLPAREKQQEWLSQGEGEPPGPTHPSFSPGVPRLREWWGHQAKLSLPSRWSWEWGPTGSEGARQGCRGAGV
ncbi:coiled-coil domain-containing protein 42 [Catharus ustulatus]|uniref:coiled-coil domain-containing protein 42 n=1 Tax=Catharus ustulatus TaxID=91951 RepID=UPI001C5B84A9|nr:coiled-coil domain-containing protein 42 [Catharus ustulatus]